MDIAQGGVADEIGAPVLGCPSFVWVWLPALLHTVVCMVIGFLLHPFGDLAQRLGTGFGGPGPADEATDGQDESTRPPTPRRHR